MRTVTAVGHRGDPYRFRENTLASLRSAVERGADAVEIDVRLTRDAVPVLLHDDSLKRLWGPERRLADLTAKDLREVTSGGVPTLREAVLAVGDRRLMIDLPDATDASVRTVVGVVRECGAGERAYYCAGPTTMLAVRAADPGAEIAMTWQTSAPPRRTLIDAVRPRSLNYRFGLLTPGLADRVHRDGMLVSAWTPDTRRTMRRLLDLGIDSVTTNRIDVLSGLLRARGLSGRHAPAAR